MKQKSWVVHGPQASGKTTHAKQIAAALGLSNIVDDWDGAAKSYKAMDTLHLTNQVHFFHGRRVMRIEDALAKLPQGAPA